MELSDEDIKNIKIDTDLLARQTHEMLKKNGDYFEVSIVIGHNEDNVMPIYDCHGVSTYDMARMIKVLENMINIIKKDNPMAYIVSKGLGLNIDEI